MGKRVCVFGSYKSLEKNGKNEIVKLGKHLAEKGYEVITGGFGGTMEDVSRGAKSAGGRTLGVTYYKWEDKPYKKPNRFIDGEIRTENIFERIDVMLRKSDAFIVLPGGTGTLLELAACLEHINKGLMDPKPILAYGNFWKDAVHVLSGEKVLSEKARMKAKTLSCYDLVTFADTIEDVIGILERKLS